MKQTVLQPSRLAHEESGAGVPIVFLHGLTFSKATWRPIIDRLGDRFRCVAIDLPAHGASSGPPATMEDVAGQIHGLLTELRITEPVIVGHSLAAMTATVYATLYPVAGVVNVDQTLDTMPFTRVLRQLEPALRGPNFAAVFEPFRQSIGVDLLPEPLRTSTRATQTIRQDVVLGYWDEALQRSPEELQAMTDEAAGTIRVPYLAVFGRNLSDDERARLQHRLCALELEEWPDQGHMVHLMQPDRFAHRLATFSAACAAGRGC